MDEGCRDPSLQGRPGSKRLTRLKEQDRVVVAHVVEPDRFHLKALSKAREVVEAAEGDSALKSLVEGMDRTGKVGAGASKAARRATEKRQAAKRLPACDAPQIRPAPQGRRGRARGSATARRCGAALGF